MKTNTFYLILLLAWLALPQSLQVVPPPMIDYSISGHVTDQNGQPITAARLRLTAILGAGSYLEIDHKYSGADGSWSFAESGYTIQAPFLGLAVEVLPPIGSSYTYSATVNLDNRATVQTNHWLLQLSGSEYIANNQITFLLTTIIVLPSPTVGATATVVANTPISNTPIPYYNYTAPDNLNFTPRKVIGIPPQSDDDCGPGSGRGCGGGGTRTQAWPRLAFDDKGTLTAVWELNRDSVYYITATLAITSDGSAYQRYPPLPIREIPPPVALTSTGYTSYTLAEWQRPHQLFHAPWAGSVGELHADMSYGNLSISFFCLHGWAYAYICTATKYPYQDFGAVRRLPNPFHQPQKGNAIGRVRTFGDCLDILNGWGYHTMYVTRTCNDGIDWSDTQNTPANSESQPGWVTIAPGGDTLIGWSDVASGTYQIHLARPRYMPDGRQWETFVFSTTAGYSQYRLNMAIDQETAGWGMSWEGKLYNPNPDLPPTKQIMYGEFKCGIFPGCLSEPVVVYAHGYNETPQLVYGPNGSRFIFWQGYFRDQPIDGQTFDNLKIAYSASCDGVHWSDPHLVNNSPLYRREKHPAVSLFSFNGAWSIHVAWDDSPRGVDSIYYESAELDSRICTTP